MTQRPMICPRCRRLIGGDESSCSWCGAKRPRASWFGSAWTENALAGDWLIRAIITVNVAFYILSLVIGSSGAGLDTLFSVFSPNQKGLVLLGATGTIPIDGLHRPWTLISAGYLHGGILHILFNMMALRQIAPWVNREYGASRMFTIYTLAGACGFFLSYLVGTKITLGASASLCGLIGALLYYGRTQGSAYGAAVFQQVSGWVVGLVLFGFLVPGIDNWAHGGGIAGGILLGMILKYQERAPETSLHRGMAVLCGVVTAAVLGWAALVSLATRFG